MKTTHLIRKHALGGMFALGCLLAGNSFAQTNNNPKPETKDVIRVKMIRNVDGKSTVIDTTIEATNQEEVHKYLKSLKCETPNEEQGKPGERKIVMMQVDVDTKGDSAHRVMPNMSDEELQKLIEMNADGKQPKEMKGAVIQKIVIDDNGQKTEKTEVKTLKDGKWVVDEKAKADVIVMDQEMVITLVKVLIQDLDEKDRELVSSIISPRGNVKNLELQQMNFYPNPNDGKFKLSFDAASRKPLQVRILSLDGKEVYADKPDNFNGHYEKEIDISNNKKGVYILQVSQGKEQLNKKIVIE